MLIIKFIGFCISWILLAFLLDYNKASSNTRMFVGALLGMFAWLMYN